MVVVAKVVMEVDSDMVAVEVFGNGNIKDGVVVVAVVAILW